MPASSSDYIKSLDYDLDRLLAVDLQPTAQPLYPDRQRAPGAVIVCRKREIDLDRKIEANSLLNPNSGVVFPGAIIRQDHNLAEGRPTPCSLARSPQAMRVELPGLGDAGVIMVDKPDYISVTTAIDKAVDAWFENDRGYRPPVRAFSSSQKAHTKEQVSIALGFGAQWGTNSATANLKTSSDAEETTVYRTFRQVFFTVVAQNPAEPGLVFDPSVVLSEGNMPADQPPGFVRSVDYGRIILVRMSTREAVSEHEAEGTLDMLTGGVQVSAEARARLQGIASNSSFQAIVLGGGAESAALLTGDIDKIGQAITEGISFSKGTPAWPVAYTVADLKTSEISGMRMSTRYVEVERTVLPDRTITMYHRGGYVGRFTVTWMEAEGDGSNFVSKTWESGSKTNPWDDCLSFPGDARDIVVSAENDTGILWDKHRHASRSWPVLDGNKTVTIGGTTLNMSISDE